VALRYRKEEGRAPKLVAKGKGAVAERIRELAREAGVPIVPSPPLARALHKLVREGAEIPASLFHAVAEVLAYVYRLRRRRA
jgi:flagellar biosynthesis protein FlhB